MEGPTTNPFHPRLAAPNATPAKTAFDMAYFLSLATALMARSMSRGRIEVVLTSLSEPAYLTARR